MNALQIFNSPDFGQVRTIKEPDGSVLFAGFDIAAAFGYSNKNDAVRRRCRSIVKRDIPHPQNPNKTLEVLCISQGDVIRLAASSKLPGADKFEGWIFDEVIPQVLRTGAYAIPTKMPPPDVITTSDGSMPTSQIYFSIAENIIKGSLAQEKRILDLESRVNSLTAPTAPVMPITPQDWFTVTREQIEALTGRPLQHSGRFLTNLYRSIEKSSGAVLLSRVNRQKKKVRAKGATKTELEQITKLYIISLDPILRTTTEKALTAFTPSGAPHNNGGCP